MPPPSLLHRSTPSSASSSSSALTTTTARPCSSSRRRAPRPAARAANAANAANADATAPPSRRSLLLSTTSSAALSLLFPLNPAQASKLPAAADRAWQAVTGAPPDLAFPAFFLGTWRCQSSLVSAQAPLGEELLGGSDSPVAETLRRAQRDELGKGPREFRVRFVRNARGVVVFDRAFNVASLAASYGGSGGSGGSSGKDATPTDGRSSREQNLMRQIEWNRDDPNVLVIRAGAAGESVRTRVTRRSETPAPPPDAGEGADADDVAPRAFETSEFMEQVFEGAGALGPGGTLAPPRVKASQVYVKWRWRTEQEAAAGAAARGGGASPGGRPSLIVATQVVSDFLTPYDGDQNFLRAGNRPVATYTYRLAMVRDDDDEKAPAPAAAG